MHFISICRHMKEHMDVPIDTSNMSEQELQFHYFKMHDSDGNNKLGKQKEAVKIGWPTHILFSMHHQFFFLSKYPF